MQGRVSNQPFLLLAKKKAPFQRGAAEGDGGLKQARRSEAPSGNDFTRRREELVIASEAIQCFPKHTFSGMLRHFVPRNDAFLISVL